MTKHAKKETTEDKLRNVVISQRVDLENIRNDLFSILSNVQRTINYSRDRRAD